MGYLVSFLLFVAGLILHNARKTWAAPDVFFCYLWAAISFFASLRLFSMYGVSEKTWLIILVGSIAFLIGVAFADQIKMKGTKQAAQAALAAEHTAEVSIMKKRTFWIFTGLLYIPAVIGVIKTIQLMNAGYTLAEIRLASFGIVEITGFTANNGYVGEMIDTLQIAVEMLVIATGIHYFVLNTKKNYMCIIAVMGLTILGSLTDGGRFGLAYTTIELLACFSIYRGLGKKAGFTWSTKAKRSVRTLVLVMIVVLLVVTFIRGAEISTLIKGYYRYFCGNIVFFDRHLQQIDTSAFWSYSFAGLYGYWIKLLPLLNELFGIPYPETYLTAVDKILDVQTFIKIGDRMYTNAFITPFYALYADARWLGVIFGMFAFGALSGGVYKKLKCNVGGKSVVIYLIIVQMLFKMLQMYPLTHAPYAMVLVLIFIFGQEYRFRIK